MLVRSGLPQTQSLSLAVNKAVNHILSLCIQWAVYALIFYWALHLVPGSTGAILRKAYVKGIASLLGLIKSVASGLARSIIRMLFGGKTKV